MPAGRGVLLSLLAFGAALASQPTAAQTLVGTVPVGSSPVALAVNSGTNKIFVINKKSNTVTVIDGASNGTTTVNVGQSPIAETVNVITNKIYVVNNSSNTVTVVDGTTYATTSVSTGKSPQAVAVNLGTNRIYVANANGTVTTINGATNATSTITVGAGPSALALNPYTNKIYVANTGDDTVTVIDGASNSTTTVRVGVFPCAVAVNTVTNKIYIANADPRSSNGGVSVIDGAHNSVVATVLVGTFPAAVAVNSATNQIFVANSGDGTVSAIDGASNTVATISVSSLPGPLAVDSTTNKIYVVGRTWSGTVTMIDGIDDSGITVGIGSGTYPAAVALNPASNRVYVANSGNGTVSVIAGGNSPPLQFVPVSPCRVADTRNPNGPFGGPPIGGGKSRNFTIPNSGCGVPATAAAYSLNVTVVPGGPLGYLTVWPAGQDLPVVSTLNSADGRVKANATIVPAGIGGAISVFATNTTNVILDINGYFAEVTGSTLAFYPLNPCRVADTRGPKGALGGPFLKGGAPGRAFPMKSSSCGIPASALAYSLNLTAVPRAPLGYLTAWPAGLNEPRSSTLNAPTGVVTANAAIVPAGTGGDIDVIVTNDSDLVIDINGYFAPAVPGGLSLYVTLPCRALDTRISKGSFAGQLNPPIHISGTPCGVPSAAQAFVLNATVVPQGLLGFLTLWPDGRPIPLASTLNAIDGAVTSNMAIVPTIDEWIDAYAMNRTHLVLDSFSFFAP